MKQKTISKAKAAQLFAENAVLFGRADGVPEKRQRSFSALPLWTSPRDRKTPGLPLTATGSETIPHGI